MNHSVLSQAAVLYNNTFSLKHVLLQFERGVNGVYEHVDGYQNDHFNQCVALLNRYSEGPLSTMSITTEAYGKAVPLQKFSIIHQLTQWKIKGPKNKASLM
jgi:hypothetical protein